MAESHLSADGSLVTELVRPELGGPRNVSVARAVVEPGQSTHRHYHTDSDEVYYILSGEGVVTVGEKAEAVAAGDCLFIPAGQVHAARCESESPLSILCLCSPPYTHARTVRVDSVSCAP